MATGPEITAKFIADMTGLTNGVDKGTSQAGSKMDSFAKNAAVAVGGAFAIDKVVDFGKEVVGAASDMAESASKIGVVFGDQGDAVIAWSKDSSTAMGISQQAALEAAGTYGNLATALGLPQDQAVSMSESLVGLATDLASFNNVPVDTALNALKSGLTGETEPLKQFGVNINETTLKAKALSMGLITASVDQGALTDAQNASNSAAVKLMETTKKHGANSKEAAAARDALEKSERKLAKVMEGKVPTSLDAATKAQASYALMMEQTSTAQGDFSRTSDGLANQQKIAAAEFDNLKVTIGNELLPIITTLATFLSTTLVPAFETGFGWLMDNKLALAAVGGVIAAMFVAWAVSAAAAAAATIAALAPFIAIGAAVGAVAYLIYANWDTIVAATKAAWDAVVGAVQFVWNWIKDNWPLLLAIITGPIGAAVLIISRNWDTIKDAAKAVWDWLNGTWQAIVGFITAPVQAAANTISGLWDGIKGGAQAVWNWLNGTWQSISGFITSPIQSAKDTIVGLWHDIENAATSAYNWVKGKFDDLASAISGVIGGITSSVTSIVNAIKNPINGMIRAWNGLEFRIPSFTLPSVDTHIPGVGTIGGGTYGGQTFSFPNIPTLAAGGVLTSPTLFLGGEGGETEIVSPESLLRQIMREEGGRYTLNIYPRTADAADVAYGFRRLELMAGAL